jgi:hydrogenase maturation protease
MTTTMGRAHVLVAGVGNVLLGDDGFGPAVVARLARDAAHLPDTARVVDYGVRGADLRYDLLEGWDALVLVAAVPGDEPPGTRTLVAVTEADLARAPALDADPLDPLAVLASLRALGGELPPLTLVLGCVPATVAEGIGLSHLVAEAVEPAAARVRMLLGVPLATAAGS